MSTVKLGRLEGSTRPAWLDNPKLEVTQGIKTVDDLDKEHGIDWYMDSGMAEILAAHESRQHLHDVSEAIMCQAVDLVFSSECMPWDLPNAIPNAVALVMTENCELESIGV